MNTTKWGRFTLTRPTIGTLFRIMINAFSISKATTTCDNYWLQCGNPNCGKDNKIRVEVFEGFEPEAICPSCGTLNK